MAEIAASITGLATFAATVGKSLYQTFSAVANAPASVRSLHTEINIISMSLSTLASYTDAGATAPDVLPEILNELESTIESLREMVEQQQRAQPNALLRGVNQVIWTFKSEEVEELRARIGRYQQLLSMSLTLATQYVVLCSHTLYCC